MNSATLKPDHPHGEPPRREGRLADNTDRISAECLGQNPRSMARRSPSSMHYAGAIRIETADLIQTGAGAAREGRGQPGNTGTMSRAPQGHGGLPSSQNHGGGIGRRLGCPADGENMAAGVAPAASGVKTSSRPVGCRSFESGTSGTSPTSC